MKFIQTLWDQMRAELSDSATPPINRACHSLLSGALGPLTERQVEDLESVNNSIQKLTAFIKGKPIDWDDDSEAAHALRGPLNSTIGFSRLILKGIDGPITKAQEQALETIYTISRRLLVLFNLLLDARLLAENDLAFDIQSLPVGEILRELITTGRRLADSQGFAFWTEVADETSDILINGDGKRFKQALMALLVTAMKYQGDDTTTLRTWLNEKTLLIQLENHGCQLPPALFSNLSNLLTNEADHSFPYDAHLRLGLAWRLVNEMGGCLEARQTDGSGTFTVTFPIV